MTEVGFALIGAILYAVLGALLLPFVGPHWLGFLVGYMVVATVDLWRCWRSTPWRRIHATTLEMTVAALFLFPLGSLLWLPWDATRFMNRA